MSECLADIIGETCECRECKPRSPAQIANDKKLRWRGKKRHWMESMPEWVRDHRLGVNIDPYIDEIAPDPLVDELMHERDPYEVFRDSTDKYIDMAGEEYLDRQSRYGQRKWTSFDKT